MKATLAFLLTLAGAALGQNSVSVSGDAEVKVVPDRVDISLGVEARSKDLAAARRQNDTLVRAVLAVPGRFGVAAEDVQTDFMNVGIDYEIDGLTVKYYSVRKSVSVLLRDISKFEQLVTAAIDAGATHLHGIEFHTSDLRRYRDEARALAVKAAMEKARDLAAAAGRKTGRVTSISAQYGGGSWYGHGWYGRWSGGMAQNVIQMSGPAGGGGAGGTVALGRISVTASVGLTVELE